MMFVCALAAIFTRLLMRAHKHIRSKRAEDRKDDEYQQHFDQRESIAVVAFLLSCLIRNNPFLISWGVF